ncbi:MAG TPA: hypothetical protein VGK81_03885 [Anaerolineae bacterium]
MNWKTRVTLIGGVLGLLIGVASAMLYIRTVQGEQGDHEKIQLPNVKTSDVLPILVTVIGLARTIAGLGTLGDK